MGRLALLFYHNPRLLILLVGVVIACGWTAIQVLPRMEDPLMKPRAATIRTFFPGASSGRVETLVTEPIERRLLEIEEIRLMRSGSRRGYSLIAIELQDDVEEVEPVWSEIRDKLADAQSELPEGSLPPEFENLEFRAASLMVSVQWTSDQPTNWAIISRIAKDVRSELRGISGTDKVEIFGLPGEQFSIEISKDQLAANGLSMLDLASKLSRSDAKISSGLIQGDFDATLLEMTGDFDSLERLSNIPVGINANGQSVTLRQVATITKSVNDPAAQRVLVGGRDAIVLVGYQRSNHRIDRWTQETDKVVASLQSDLPSGVAVEVDFQQSRYVMQRLNSLVLNLGLGALAVMLVVFIIMGWRGSILVGLTLPLTCLAVLGSMWMLEIPLQQMSVTGIILALGLLIDNAIVIVDEVQAALDEGASVVDAIRDCIDHLAVPLFGSTLTTVLAFAPLIIMIGPAAEFVYSISTSVIAAIIASYFFSMTVVPALLGWLRAPVNFPAIDSRSEKVVPSADIQRELDGTSNPNPSIMSTSSENLKTTGVVKQFWVNGCSNSRVTEIYRASLLVLFRFPLLAIAISLVLPIAGFIGATQLPEQFFPSADRDQFTIKLELGPGKTLNQTVEIARSARQLMMQDPRIKRADWYIGRSAPPFYVNLIPLRKDTPNFAQAFVELDGEVADETMLQQLQDRLQMHLPMVRVNVQQLQLGPPLDDPIEIRIFGPDRDTLNELGDQVRSVLSSTKYVTATVAQLGTVTPALAWNFDPSLLQQVGLDRQAVANELSAQLDGVLVGSVLEGREEIPVRLRLDPEDRGTVDAIASLTFNRKLVGENQSIPISTLGNWELQPSDSSIQRIDNQRVNEIRAQVESGQLPSVVLSEFKSRLVQQGFSLPPGYSILYGGESAERDRAVGNLLATAPVLGLIMFSTIVLSFRSFRAAFLIGGVGFFSIGLGLLSLYLFNFPFGFMAIVGTMGLVGVAINDSIVVLASLTANPKARQGDLEATVNVVVRCTRHVLATTFTTIAGFIPLLVQGGGFWPPLAISIAGGVGGATLLALYFVPALYLLTVQAKNF